MTRNKTVDYTKYIHEFEDKNGKIRFAVAEWNEQSAEFICPLDKRTQQLTGCYAKFSKTPSGLGGYITRTQALRRARYLFSEKE